MRLAKARPLVAGPFFRPAEGRPNVPKLTDYTIPGVARGSLTNLGGIWGLILGGVLAFAVITFSGAIWNRIRAALSGAPVIGGLVGAPQATTADPYAGYRTLI